jgi:hypothetical protein
MELLTTDEFAAWFSTLESGPAEDVAATLDVIVELGSRRDAPGSSEWLLWYEHPSVAGRVFPDIHAQVAPEIVKFSQEWGRFLTYTRRVVKHLESKAFASRLTSLRDEDAAKVTAAVARIRKLGTARALALSALQVKRRFFVGKAPTPQDVATLAGFLDESEVREAYFEALAAAGFEVEDAPAQGSALREISLRSRAPGLRLLYGIDEKRGRGLVVLGEWLDRSFYGDSVRRAESLWARFLEEQALPAQAASVR